MTPCGALNKMGGRRVGNLALHTQPLTTDTAIYDIIGRTYYVGFKAKF
jgi:hypothetical protein